MMEIVIGIDPGTQKTGYAVVAFEGGQKFTVLEFGTWVLTPSHKKRSLAERLEILFHEAQQLFRKHNPSVLAVEYAVVHKSPLASLKVSEARGVLRLAAQHNLADLEERWLDLSPTQVKKMSTGFGRSIKSQVTSGMKLRMRMGSSHSNQSDALEETPKTSDSYDALAIAFAAYRLSRKKHLITLDSLAKTR